MPGPPLLLESLRGLDLPDYIGVPNQQGFLYPLVVPEPTMIPMVFPLVPSLPPNPEDAVMRRGVFWSLDSDVGRSQLGWPFPHDIPMTEYAASDSWWTATEYLIEAARQSQTTPATKWRLKRRWEAFCGRKCSNTQYCKLMGCKSKEPPALWPSVQYDVLSSTTYINGPTRAERYFGAVQPPRSRLPLAIAGRTYPARDSRGRLIDPIAWRPGPGWPAVQVPPGAYWYWYHHREEPHILPWWIGTITKRILWHGLNVLELGSLYEDPQAYDTLISAPVNYWLNPGPASPWQLWLWAGVWGGLTTWDPAGHDWVPLLQ